MCGNCQSQDPNPSQVQNRGPHRWHPSPSSQGLHPLPLMKGATSGDHIYNFLSLCQLTVPVIGPSVGGVAVPSLSRSPFSIKQTSWSKNWISETMNWKTCIKKTTWYQRGCQKIGLSQVAEPTQQLPPGSAIHTSLLNYQGWKSPLFTWGATLPHVPPAVRYLRGPWILHICVHWVMCVVSASWTQNTNENKY